MKKGKFGVTYAFYAAFAFLAAIFGQPLLCLLVLGFVLAADRDEWAVRQIIQASVCSLITAALLKAAALSLAVLPVAAAVSGTLYLILLAGLLWSLFRVCRSKDVRLPVVFRFANWSHGLILKKVYVQVREPVTGWAEVSREAVNVPENETAEQEIISDVPEDVIEVVGTVITEKT